MPEKATTNQVNSPFTLIWRGTRGTRAPPVPPTPKKGHVQAYTIDQGWMQWKKTDLDC